PTPPALCFIPPPPAVTAGAAGRAAVSAGVRALGILAADAGQHRAVLALIARCNTPPGAVTRLAVWPGHVRLRHLLGACQHARPRRYAYVAGGAHDRAVCRRAGAVSGA